MKLCCIKRGNTFTDPKKMTVSEIVNALNRGEDVYEVNLWKPSEMTRLDASNFITDNFSNLEGRPLGSPSKNTKSRASLELNSKLVLSQNVANNTQGSIANKPSLPTLVTDLVTSDFK